MKEKQNGNLDTLTEEQKNELAKWRRYMEDRGKETTPELEAHAVQMIMKGRRVMTAEMMREAVAVSLKKINAKVAAIEPLDQRLRYVAELIEWNFLLGPPAPDEVEVWELPHAPLSTLCAVSVALVPWCAEHMDWVEHVVLPELRFRAMMEYKTPANAEEQAEKITEFLRRHKIGLSHLKSGAAGLPVLISGRHGPCVSPTDFSQWAAGLGWKISPREPRQTEAKVKDAEQAKLREALAAQSEKGAKANEVRPMLPIKLLLAALALIGSIVWCIVQPDYEPIIAIVTSLLTFITFWPGDSKSKRLADQNQTIRPEL